MPRLKLRKTPPVAPTASTIDDPAPVAVPRKPCPAPGSDRCAVTGQTLAEARGLVYLSQPTFKGWCSLLVCADLMKGMSVEQAKERHRMRNIKQPPRRKSA